MTLPSSEITFGAMNGSTHASLRLPSAARDLREPTRARANVSSWASRSLKVFLVALVFFASAPICISHAKSHFARNCSESQLTAVATDVAALSEQDDGSADTILFGGLEHHNWCGCPYIDASPSRSCYKSAYLDGQRVRYPAYLDALAAKFEPAPLQKPPRLVSGA